jgi:hypothetical protein
MTGAFEAFVPVTRVWKDDGGQMWFEGIASSTSVDKQNERMTERAIRKMASCTGIDLLPSHDAGPLQELGVVTETCVDNQKLRVAGLLDPDNPDAVRFFRKAQSGRPYQLSVGGRVKSAFWQFDPALSKHVKHIDDVELDHIAVCRAGRAANPDTYLTVMAKSIELPEPEVEEDGWIERLAKAVGRVVGRNGNGTSPPDPLSLRERGTATSSPGPLCVPESGSTDSALPPAEGPGVRSASADLAKDLDVLKADLTAAIEGLRERVERLERLRGVKQSLDGQQTQIKAESLWRGVV